ncbi:MAG: tyrosinase family protein [Deltaproteobacteria bacterium]|nr:tyrosinase family protein [Deltaproteobacteria bacterium]
MKRTTVLTFGLALVAYSAAMLAAVAPAHAYLPNDAVITYDAHVPGRGWLPRVYGGSTMGPNDPNKRITGIRVRVDRWVGPSSHPYPDARYGVCYSIKQAGRSWSAEGCNGTAVGSLSGGKLENMRVRLITPTGVAANVCYGVSMGEDRGWEENKCDGGSAPGMFESNIVNFFLYVTGAPSRGRHTRSVYDLTGSQRTLLSTKIRECVTQDVLTHHGHVNHEHGPEVFTAHRTMIQELERCLTSRGASQFVPLPYWNPGETIPSDLRSVKQIGSSNFPALERFDTWRANFDAAKPARLAPWNLFWHGNLEELGDWQFLQWHNGVHDSIGGIMANPQNSPAAVIFWPWHAYVDNIYTQWEKGP